MGILYVGIDFAKNVFAVHGVDEHGKPALVRPSVPRVNSGRASTAVNARARLGPSIESAARAGSAAACAARPADRPRLACQPAV
jgi:hypothetical protein